MFTAIVSIAGLIASAYLGRRELTRRKESGERSGMGWGITFCIMQAIAVALGFLGMAPDDILSPIILNAVLTACAWASFARDITWARIESYMRFGDELAAAPSNPTAVHVTSTMRAHVASPATRTSPASVAWAASCAAAPHELRIALHRPTAVCVMLLCSPAVRHARTRDPLQP